ncbi:MAG: LptA/OstA family protein [Candidatus Aminicenantes bacterium]
MNRLDTPFIRALKYLTLLLLAAVVVAVGINFFFRAQNRTPVKPQDQDIGLRRMEEKEKIRHMEEEKGRPVLEFEAERHYRGTDGLYHLEGSVWVAFPQPGQKENILFTGEEIIHDEEGEWFQVNGQARIEFEDMTVDASSLKYDSKEGVVGGDEGVGFHSSRLTGKAEKVLWNVRRKELFLQKNVRLEMTPGGASDPVLIDCDEIEYLRKWGHGFLRGDVEVHIGNNHARADIVEFRLTSDREYLRSVKMEGRAEVRLGGNETGESSPAESPETLEGLLAAGGKSFISEEMAVIFFHDEVKIQEFRSNQKCEGAVANDSGDSMRLSSQELRFRLNRGGGLKEFFARGLVRLHEEKEKEENFRIEAGVLRIKSRKNVLEILRGESGAAKVTAPGFEVWGGDMEYYLSNRNLEVNNGAEVVLDPSGNTNPGFFSSSEPLFIKSEEMRYVTSSQRFIFKGETKFWQQKEMLESENLVLDKGSGKVSAEGDVRFVFHYKTEDGDEERRIEITAQKLDYQPSRYRIFFEEDCSFTVEGAVLEAGEITLGLGEGEGKMRGLSARTHVVIKQGSYEAQGGQAFFSAEQNEIVLTGKPVLTDKDQGRTEGDKLIFNLSGGKIIIENQGRKRSHTVIKKP